MRSLRHADAFLMALAIAMENAAGDEITGTYAPRQRGGRPQTMILTVPGSRGRAGTTVRGLAKHGGSGVDLLHWDERPASDAGLVIEWGGDARDRAMSSPWCGSTLAHEKARREGIGDDGGPVVQREMAPEELARWRAAREWARR